MIGHGAEEGDAAVGGAVGFETFEKGLAVVQRGGCWRELHWAERDNARVLPLAVGVVGDEHVVAVVGTEGRVFAESFGEAGLRDAGEGDGCEHVDLRSKSRRFESLCEARIHQVWRAWKSQCGTRTIMARRREIGR